MNRKTWKLQTIAWVMGFATMFFSCQRFYDPPLFFEEYGTEKLTGKAKKVLLVTIDGAVGPDVSLLAPTNIASLQKTSKYTYDLKVTSTTSTAAIVSAVNGVPQDNHLIVDESFVPKTSGNSEEHLQLPSFPTFYKYIKLHKRAVKTAFFSSWRPLYEHIGVYADERKLTDSDEASKNEAVAAIANNRALGVVGVNFRSVLAAGSNGGFTLSNDNYKNALNTVDGYIGELVAAVKARKSYADEDWVIMLVSPAGGNNDVLKSGFMLVHNDRLKEAEVRKTASLGVYFGWDGLDGTRRRRLQAILPHADTKGLYDPGADKDFSVQITVKIAKGKSWPGFFGKSTGVSGGTTTGWLFAQAGNTCAIMLGGSDNGTAGKLQINANTVVADDKWHQLTATFKKEGSRRIVKFYVDSVVQNNTGTDIGTRNLTTTAPFTIGYLKVDGSGDTDFYALDAVYFNKALTEQEVKDNLFFKDVTKHTARTNIVGYWTLDEGFGAKMRNYAEGAAGADFTLTGPITWYDLAQTFPPNRIEADIDTPSIIASPYDVPSLIFYWIDLKVNKDWGLQGDKWLERFDKELFLL